jgi:hypothetical protein
MKQIVLIAIAICLLATDSDASRRRIMMGKKATPSVAAFSPLDYDGLKGWWIADDAASGAVATWPDASGNGNDLVQASAPLRPNRIDSVVNGHHVLRWSAHELSDTSFSIPGTNLMVWCYDPTNGPGSVLRSDEYWMLQWSATDFHRYNSTGIRTNIDTGFRAVSYYRKPLAINDAVNTYEALYQPGIAQFHTLLYPSGAIATDTALHVGHNGASDYHFDGDIAELLIYDTSTWGTNQITLIDRRETILGYLTNKYAITPARTEPHYIFADGDSLTAGAIDTGAAGAYTVRLATLLGSTDYKVINCGVGGQTVYQMTNDLPIQVLPYDGGGRGVYVCWEYYNIRTETETDAWSGISNACYMARSQGFKVLVATDYHETGNIQAVSDNVRNNYAGFADGLVELDLQALRDASVGDGVHSTEAGLYYVATNVYNAIIALFP